MKKVRLLYFSKATRDMALSDLKDILQTARENNSNLGICGMLCYDNRYFLQALEGDRETVNELYLHIADDPRHDSPTICAFEYIDTPIFNNWQMGYASSSPLFNQILAKMKQTEFEPEQLTPNECLELLEQLSANQSQI